MDLRMPTTTDIVTLQKAINTYGRSAQEDMALEEMSELTKALLKRRRAIKKNADAHKISKVESDIKEEIADVIITLKQLILLYDSDGDIQEAINKKIKRLRMRLRMEENE